MPEITTSDLRELLRLMEIFERRPARSSRELDHRRRAKRMHSRLERIMKNKENTAHKQPKTRSDPQQLLFL